MNLHRDILQKLLDWKNSSSRLPLLIKGARQCGKSWCMKEFGRRNYERTAYFNFDIDTELKEEFKNTKNPSRLIPILEIYCGFKIEPDTTLIVLDEIQECNEALNSLKYFVEEAPQFHIIAAGSLLGVALGKEGGSFPVGNVEFIDMYPLTFKEFLYNADIDCYNFVDEITSPQPLPLIIYNRLQQLHKRYLICGGMPKAVLAMIEHNDISKVDEELSRILEAYSLDFSKHASPATVPRISEIWRSLPSQLAKENRKFVFKLIRSGARAREYETALEWLQLAGLVYKIHDTENPIIPLSAYDDVSAFKIYLFDVGILRALSQIPAEIFISSNPSFREFKGVFAENAALQAFVPQFRVLPRYWTSQGRAEVDFVIQCKEHVLPVEVKAESNKSGKSLGVYIEKYRPRKAVTVTSLNVSVDRQVLNIPHPLASWLGRWLDF